jgi:hypothetical protein
MNIGSKKILAPVSPLFNLLCLKSALYALLISFQFISCKNRIEQTKTIISNSSENKIKIFNNSNKTVYFRLNINNKIYDSENELAKAVNSLPDEYPNEPHERKAWRFVMLNLLNLESITSENWVHDPLLLMNSLGFGQCDDMATLLSSLWIKLGFQSRIWDLKSHVVPEVFVNNKWQMYDPALGVYYLNDKNEVAGVEELSKNPDLIINPRKPLGMNKYRWIIHASRRYSKGIAKVYESKNSLSDWYYLEKKMNDFQIELPKESIIEFPVSIPDPIYVNDIIDQWKLPCFIKYTLPKKWSGEIKIPFIICGIYGKGSVIINNKKYDIEQYLNKDYLKKVNSNSNKLKIINSENNIEVYCLLNPNVFNKYGADDSIIISGQNINDVLLLRDTIDFSSDTELDVVSFHSNSNSISEQSLKCYLNYTRDSSVGPINLKHPENKFDKEKLFKKLEYMLFSKSDISDKEKTEITSKMVDKLEKVYDLLSEEKKKEMLIEINEPAFFSILVGALILHNESEVSQLLFKYGSYKSGGHIKGKF